MDVLITIAKRRGKDNNVESDYMEDFELSMKKKSRFSKPTSDDRMKEISKGYVSKNTQKNTAWGVNVHVFLEG